MATSQPILRRAVNGDLYVRIKPLVIPDGDASFVPEEGELCVFEGQLYLGDGSTVHGVLLDLNTSNLAKLNQENHFTTMQHITAPDGSGVYLKIGDPNHEYSPIGILKFSDYPTAMLSFLVGTLGVIGGNVFRAGSNPLNVAVTGIGFFGAEYQSQQAVTGALSSVADANAKAVLTSLINALAAYGLITKSTT